MALGIPSIKQNKKLYVAVGGAAAAFVAYRWYQNRSAASAAAAPVDPNATDTSSVTDATGGAYGPGNVQYGGADITGDTSTLTTNAEWTNTAVTLMVQQGWDGATVQAALGKYLTDQALTTDEETIVRSAVAVAGNPPQGSHAIVHIPNPTPSTPTTPTASAPTQAPSGLHTRSSTTTGFTAQWNAVPDATRYRVVVPGLGYDWQTASLVHDIPVPANKRKTRIVVQVYAGNNNQQFGPMAQYWSTTK